MPKMPLLEEISEYLKHSYLGFHTPGHQQGKGSIQGFQELDRQGLLQIDLTEVPGLDNLHNPSGCLRDSQNLAAKLFEAQATFYLVNGSTGGLLAALLALNAPRGKVVIPRHAHISVLNGLVLSGGEPLIAPVMIEKTWGIPLGVCPDVLNALLEKEGVGSTDEAVRGTGGVVTGKTAVDFVLTVNPSYQGVGFTAGVINNIIKKKGLPHVVDEAHGAHLYFQKRCPLSLQKEKADLVIQSTHKTMAALTQASMLHVNTASYIAPVREALNILQTTSPSYLLMASLDSVQAQMHSAGASLVDKAMELADLFRKEILRIPGYQVFPEERLPQGWHYDPQKILVSAAPLGLTGWELAELLRAKQNIIVEMSDYYAVLFLVTWGHNYEDIIRTCRALREISREYKDRKKPLAPMSYPTCIYEEPLRLLLIPREVYYNRKEAVRVGEAAGRICGEALTVYPPGIPCLWPGQVIEPVQIEYLEWAVRHNLKIRGVSEDGKIMVLNN